MIAGWPMRVGNPAIKANLVGNHYIKGPSAPTTNGVVLVSPDVEIFMSQNLSPDHPSTPVDGFGVNTFYQDRDYANDPGAVLYAQGAYDPVALGLQVASAHSTPAIPSDDVTTLKADLVANAGAILPVKHATWVRMTDDVINDTGSVANHNDYPTLSSGTPPTDTSGDGIPDSWKTSHGLKCK